MDERRPRSVPGTRRARAGDVRGGPRPGRLTSYQQGASATFRIWASGRTDNLIVDLNGLVAADEESTAQRIYLGCMDRFADRLAALERRPVTDNCPHAHGSVRSLRMPMPNGQWADLLQCEACGRLGMRWAGQTRWSTHDAG